MTVDAFKEILNNNTEDFLNRIAIELEEKHSRWLDDFGFPIFANIPSDYHEQVYFQSYLEAYTRDMINGILREYFWEESDTIYKWPGYEGNKILIGHTNAEFENEFDFEFIDVNEKIGFKYASLHFDELVNLIEKSKMKKIITVDWGCGEDEPGIIYDDNRFELISVYEFFSILLREYREEHVQELYKCFMKSITGAVNSAVRMISLQTIPGFTPLYLHDFRKRVINDIEQKSEEDIFFFVKNKKYKINEEKSKGLIKRYSLFQVFIRKGFHHSLVSNSDYAKSFLTSEYLYQYFENNTLFDYTPIVCGYLKSIEQLVRVICVKYREDRNINEPIKNPNLGTYTEILQKEEGVFRKDICNDRHIITDCLKSYRIESRNRLFHKDYFNTWDRVTQIRNNTIYLFIALLASVDMSSINTNGSVLDLLDEGYEHLYGEITKRKYGTFTIVYEDRRYRSMELVSKNRVGLRYDARGVVNNELKFKRDDCFYDEEEYLTITNKNVPLEVWIEDCGKLVKRIW